MDEEVRKKTVPAWRPPTAATREGLAPFADVTGPLAHDVTQAAHPVSAPQPARTLGPGDVIGGRYVIKALAGQGGFAAVYRAADGEIANHEVALKLLNAPAISSEAQAAALRELTLIASVSHPSVVQFKDYGWHEGRLYFAMPWYRGRTLGSALPLDRASARRVFERCAYGLSAMHEAGICHYDIKPDNIFLADIEGFEAGFPVLLDLGIAAKRGETPTALTPEYASPETALSTLNGGGTQVGTAADVFSLALSLRNVLEPESAPVFGDSLPAMLHQRATQLVPPLTRPEFRYLKPLFERWLSLEPSERPSAAEFAVELAALTEPEERRAERRRTLLRAAPFVGVLVLVASGLAFELTNKTKELVHQKAVEVQEGVKTTQRFEKLKQQSRNQLDEKLQLAQEFQTQRDGFRVQRDQTRAELETSRAEGERTRGELRIASRERDQTRKELQAQTLSLEQTRADLERRTQDLETRSRELAQTRSERDARAEEVATRTQELARQTQALDQAQIELARRTKELQAQTGRLEEVRASLETRTQDLERVASARDKAAAELERRTRERDKLLAELERSTSDRDKANAELERRTRERDKARGEVDALEQALKATPKGPDQPDKPVKTRAKKGKTPPG